MKLLYKVSGSSPLDIELSGSHVNSGRGKSWPLIFLAKMPYFLLLLCLSGPLFAGAFLHPTPKKCSFFFPKTSRAGICRFIRFGNFQKSCYTNQRKNKYHNIKYVNIDKNGNYEIYRNFMHIFRTSSSDFL